MRNTENSDSRPGLSSLRLDLLLGDTDFQLDRSNKSFVPNEETSEQLRLAFAEPETFEERVIACFRDVAAGRSVDSLLADAAAAEKFHNRCWSRGAPGSSIELNTMLLRLRKRGKLRSDVPVRRRVQTIPDDVMLAAELAMAVINEERSEKTGFSFDALLTDNSLAQVFETVARSIVPGYKATQYILAALRFRKANSISKRLQTMQSTNSLWDSPKDTFSRVGLLEDVTISELPQTRGLYLLRSQIESVYIGRAMNIRNTWKRVDRGGALDALFRIVDPQSLDTLALEVWPIANASHSTLLSFQRREISLLRPRFNPSINAA